MPKGFPILFDCTEARQAVGGSMSEFTACWNPSRLVLKREQRLYDTRLCPHHAYFSVWRWLGSVCWCARVSAGSLYMEGFVFIEQRLCQRLRCQGAQRASGARVLHRDPPSSLHYGCTIACVSENVVPGEETDVVVWAISISLLAIRISQYCQVSCLRASSAWSA